MNVVLAGMLRTVFQHGIMWIGISRVGKSSGSKTVALAVSEYAINVDEQHDMAPSVISAKYIDFLKNQPIARYLPAIFDDGLLQKLSPDVIKAFLNP